MKEYDLRGDETFMKMPGFAMICEDLCLLPNGKKFGKLVLCGFPPIRFKSKMKVTIQPQFQAEFQCSFTPIEDGILHPNFIIPIAVTNLTDRNAFIPKRALAAKVVLASSPPGSAMT